MTEINRELARINEEWMQILADYTPYMSSSKRERLHDLEERSASLFARKRALLAQRRNSHGN